MDPIRLPPHRSPESRTRVTVVGDLGRALAEGHPFTRALWVSHAGVYPRARGHRCIRERGCGEWVFLFCIEGRGWVDLSGKQSELVSGSVAILPPHKPHGYGADAARPWTLWWMHLEGTQVEGLQQGEPALAPGVKFLENLSAERRILGRLLGRYEQGVDVAALVFGATAAWTILGSLQEGGAATRGLPDADGVALAIQTMHRDLARDWSVADLAGPSGWSVAHFAHRFKAATGHGPLEYLIRLRMDRAAWLLANTQGPLSEVAEAVGYLDMAYFSRRFSRHHGMAPSVFKGKRRGK